MFTGRRPRPFQCCVGMVILGQGYCPAQDPQITQILEAICVQTPGSGRSPSPGIQIRLIRVTQLLLARGVIYTPRVVSSRVNQEYG